MKTLKPFIIPAPPQTDMKHPYRKVFLTAVLLFLVTILPILVCSGGVYLYTGDYAAQTIPFTEHLSRLLHGDGLSTIDWQTGLGMDTLLAYGGYLTSPFVLPLLAVPVSVLPYVHTLAVALKVGLSAVTAALYCRQYVRRNRTAFLCGMLYAFSGFQLFNLVFPFLNSICLFPLMLWSFDKLVTEKRRFVFALVLALQALTDVMILWAECLFIAMYYIVRVCSGSFPKLTRQQFLRFGTESLAGIGLIAFLIVPTALSLMQNDRAGNLIFEHNLLAYEDRGVIWHILQSIVMPPDPCRNGWYFSDLQLTLSPPVLYIPLFTLIGACAVLRKNKKSWYARLLVICAVFACIPLLNSAFSMFNSNYYARWYLCPLLMLIMLTGVYLDDPSEYDVRYEYALGVAITGLFVLLGLFRVFVQKAVKGTAAELWALGMIFACCGLVCLYGFAHPQEKLQFLSVKHMNVIVCVLCALPFIGQSLCFGAASVHGNQEDLIRTIWNDFEPVTIRDDTYYRITSTQNGREISGHNAGLVWGYPSIQLFNSMVSGAETDFYALLGNLRAQSSGVTWRDFALASFLSVKYDLYVNHPLTGGVKVETQHVLSSIYENEGYDLMDEQGSYLIFENSAFIPMGFAYDYYLPIEPMRKDPEQYESADPTRDREKLLLKAIWLDEEQAEKYADILTKLPDDIAEDLSVEAYYRDCKARAASACDVFSPRENGFDAHIDLEKKNLVVFTVPYSKGYTAYVDGQPQEIEVVFDGMMAVCVPEGSHEIRFDYETPGLTIGIVISAVSGGVLLIYAAAAILLDRRRKTR